MAPGLSWSRCDRRWHNGKASSVGVGGEERAMSQQRLGKGALPGAAGPLPSPAAPAGESDPLPVPRGTPRERAISMYNEGVGLMREKHYAAAQEKFEQALALDETL